MDFPGKASAIAVTKDQTATLYPAVLSDRYPLGPC
jgi:hypothetical protein